MYVYVSIYTYSIFTMSLQNVFQAVASIESHVCFSLDHVCRYITSALIPMLPAASNLSAASEETALQFSLSIQGVTHTYKMLRSVKRQVLRTQLDASELGWCTTSTGCFRLQHWQESILDWSSCCNGGRSIPALKSWVKPISSSAT